MTAHQHAGAESAESNRTFQARRRFMARGRISAKAMVIAGLVVAAGGVATAVVVSNTGKSEGTMEGGTLDHFTVMKSSFDVMTTSSGELECKNQIEIRNKIEQGQVTIVEIVEEGKMVKKGDLLVRLSDDSIKTQLNEERLSVESSRADAITAEENLRIQVSTNDSNLRQAMLKVELAELDLQKWLEGEVKTRKLELKLGLERAEDELKRLSEKATRSRTLFEEKFLSADELQRDELALKEAQAALEKAVLAERTYEQYEYPKDQKQKNSDVEEAKAEKERVEGKNTSELAAKQADLNNKKEQLKIREDRLAKLNTQLEAATIIAPADGLVVYGSTAEQAKNGWFRGDGPLAIGSQVYQNQLLIVLPDTTEMVATVRVHESLASRIENGQLVNVKVEAAGGRVFTGKVLSKGVLAESGGWRDPNLREYTVKVALDGIDDAALKPSMRCEAEIKLAHVADAVAVPLQAVFNEGPLRYVYMPSGNRYTKKAVKVGRRSDRFIEIVTGAEPGERVLLRQPAAGEVLDKKWTETELASVGMKLDDTGKVVAMAPLEGPGGPGKRGGKGGGEAATISMSVGAGAVQVVKADGAAVTDAAAGTTGDVAAPAADTSDDGEKKDEGDKVETKPVESAAAPAVQPAATEGK
ncbi:MAG: hypothetical protein H7Y88_03330 [Phycisphaerales bacterium]|nr:hypothetical protein [Phycisphaerales bacterium]